jgi:hypothetical protein
MSLLLPTLVALLQTAAPGCDTSAERSLFDCEIPLELTLELPMKTLLRRAESRPVLDGKLEYINAGGEPVILDIQVSTRGHSRLETCKNPPLSLTFDKKQVRETIFAGQKKLKIVTPCKSGNRYLEYLRQEYGIYRAYNVVAHPSFRVRLLQITFRDSEEKRRDEIQVAFFIESPREVATRSRMETIKLQKIAPQKLDMANSSTYELFQFLIANTDWSKIKGPGDEDCCHNGKVLRKPGTESGWVVMPYDFDQAGLINVPYAQPDEHLPIQRVSQRLFRGRCEFLGHMDATIALFNHDRLAIEAALASGGVSEKTLKSQTKYVAKFYEIINDPKQRQRYIEDRCRGSR